jgi:hypothetical protein
MFQKLAEGHGFEKKHFFIQCGFRKITGANFNVFDIRLFMECTLRKQIETWIISFGFTPCPYYKIEISRHPSGFNGNYVIILSDLDQLTDHELLRMKSNRPFSLLFVRMYYK